MFSHCFFKVSNSDTASLVHHEDGARNTQVRIPPEWTDSLEEAQYILSKIQTRLKELTSLQSKHLTKPTFDDSLGEEKQIDELTQEITKVTSFCLLVISTKMYSKLLYFVS